MLNSSVFLNKYIKYKKKYLDYKEKLQYGGILECNIKKMMDDLYDKDINNANKIFSISLYLKNTVNINSTIGEKYMKYLKGILTSTQNLILNFGNDYKIRMYTYGFDSIIGDGKEFKRIINEYRQKNEKWNYNFIQNKKEFQLSPDDTYQKAIFNFLLNVFLSNKVEIYNYECNNVENNNKVDYSIQGTFGTIMRFFPFFMNEDSKLEEIHIRDADQTFANYTDLIMITVWKLLGIDYYFPSVYSPLHHYSFLRINSKKNTEKLIIGVDYLPTFALSGGKPFKNINNDDIHKIFNGILQICDDMKNILSLKSKAKYIKEFEIKNESQISKIPNERCGYGADEIFLGYTLFKYMKDSYIVLPIFIDNFISGQNVVSLLNNNYKEILKPNIGVFQLRIDAYNNSKVYKIKNFLELIDVNWDIFILIFILLTKNEIYNDLNKILVMLKSNTNIEQVEHLSKIFGLTSKNIPDTSGPLFVVDLLNNSAYQKLKEIYPKTYDTLIINIFKGMMHSYFNIYFNKIDINQTKIQLQELAQSITFDNNINVKGYNDFIIAYLLCLIKFSNLLKDYKYYEDAFGSIVNKENNLIQFRNNKFIVIFDTMKLEIDKYVECKGLCFITIDDNKKKFFLKIVDGNYFSNISTPDDQINILTKISTIKNIQKMINLKDVKYNNTSYQYALMEYIAGYVNTGIYDIYELKEIVFGLIYLINELKKNKLAFVDIHPNNIIINKNGIFLIDLENIISYGQKINRYGKFSPNYIGKSKLKNGYSSGYAEVEENEENEENEESEENKKINLVKIIQNDINNANLLSKNIIENETIDLFCLGETILSITNKNHFNFSNFRIYASYLKNITSLNMQLNNTTKVEINEQVIEQIKKIDENEINKIYDKENNEIKKLLNEIKGKTLDRTIEQIFVDMKILFCIK